MKAQLLDNGLKDSVFEPGEGRRITGEKMARLCRTLAAMEDALVALERRGIGLKTHAVRQDRDSLLLPVFHVFLGRDDHGCQEEEK